jgi:endoglucanase
MTRLGFVRSRKSTGSVLVAVVASGCLSAAPQAATDESVPPRGCTLEAGSPPPVAPNGYYTNGGTVCTADGIPHVFRGVDRPSLEWSSDGVNITQADFQLMASWGANVVRIALNQDFWLSGAALYDASYRATVDQAVQWAEQAGLDVILDLHWSDTGNLGAALNTNGACPAVNGQPAVCSAQQPMADANSIEFWKEVAGVYQGDGRVLFELYNEPHGVAWNVWLNGGPAAGFTVAGMQQLYGAVRGAGANNVVIAGGLDWAYDLSGVGPSGVFVDGYNVMYATHPYLTSGDASSGWESSFGHLETTDFAPVIATEFGDGTTPNCKGDWDQDLIAFLEAHRGSWTAWAWYPGVDSDDPQGCHFPSLILDWNATPSVQGAVVEENLQEHSTSTISGVSPSAADASDE